MKQEKLCPSCGMNKSLGDFGTNKSKRDGLQSQCRACQKLSQDKWYTSHRREHQARVKLRRYNHRDGVVSNILDYFKTHPCVDCTESDPLVLEFDHVRGQKKYAIQDMVNRGYGWQYILEEIAKCDVRCANCHRRKTAKEFSYRKIFLATVARQSS